MLITDFLPRSNVFELSARSKEAVLAALARHAARAVGLGDHGPLLEALLKREELGSTGMGGAIAMPHAYLPELDRPVGFLARLDTAIDFDAVDGQPVEIVVLLLLSTRRQGAPLNAMACAARCLRDPAVVVPLFAASGTRELHDAPKCCTARAPITPG